MKEEVTGKGRKTMESPLQALRESLPIESQGMADQNRFSFGYLYPLHKGVGKKDRVSMQTSVEWFPEKDGVSLMTELKGILIPKTTPSTFMGDFYRELALFVNSNVKGGDPPEGSLTVQLQPGGALAPALEVSVPYKQPDKPESIINLFGDYLSYSCLALWIARGVFSRLARSSQAPKAPERFELLLKAYGSREIMYPAEESEPSISFPPGLFGGKVGKLRPQ